LSFAGLILNNRLLERRAIKIVYIAWRWNLSRNYFARRINDAANSIRRLRPERSNGIINLSSFAN
jgi:hypothetical protein